MSSHKVLRRRIRYLATIANIPPVFGTFTAVLGTMWLIVRVGNQIHESEMWTRWYVNAAMLAIPALWALWANFPRLKCSTKARDGSVEIEIKVGDILEEQGHIIIGCNDCFDTELPRSPSDPEIISPGSVQGQFQRKYYAGREDLIDNEIRSSLQNRAAAPIRDTAKFYGKQDRYSIGSVAVLRNAVDSREQWVFLPAVARMLPEERTAQVDKDEYWISLSALWSTVREHCGRAPVYTPVLGRGFGRLKPQSTRFLVQLIIMSFIMETAQRHVTRKLTVVIYDGDYSPGDMACLSDFLKSLDF